MTERPDPRDRAALAERLSALSDGELPDDEVAAAGHHCAPVAFGEVGGAVRDGLGGHAGESRGVAGGVGLFRL